MKKQEKTISALAQFLPPRTFDLIAPHFRSHTIHLSLTHERKTVLGDYRHPTKDCPYHRISVNINLNPYSFLITLLHELAHLHTFVHFGLAHAPHGREWKTQFRHILIPYIGKNIFPKDVEKALMAYIHNPAASTCTDPALYKALYSYDARKPGHRLVDEIKVGGTFEIEGGRIFQKMDKLRTRSRCRELKTGKVYYFQGIVEVKMVKAV